VSDEYLDTNLKLNRSKEPKHKFGDTEYASVSPVSDLADITNKIGKGIDLSTTERELEDILPIAENRIITFKDGQQVEELYLIQQFARKLQCPRTNCSVPSIQLTRIIFTNRMIKLSNLVVLLWFFL
jgi:hypothetical protein